MKILFLNSSKKWGGNERWSTSAAVGLARCGHDIFFAHRTNVFEGKFSQKIHKIKANFHHEFDLLTYFKLIKEILYNKIEIMIPTKRKEYLIAGIIGKILRIPVFFRLGIVRQFPKRKYFSRLVYKFLPTGIICNSMEIKNQLIADKILSSEKIHVVYNGYDFKSFQKEAIENKLFTFVCAGRLTSQKGFDVLLKAIRILKGQATDFIVKIAGEGVEYEVLTNFVNENNLQNHVEFLGHVDEILELFHEADAIVIPSRNEGIPNVLMEAWSQKKTVIASKSAGIPEAISNGYNGFLVDLEPKSIANKMHYVMKNKTDYIGKNGYTTLETKFTMKKMIINLENIFAKSLSKGVKYEEIKV